MTFKERADKQVERPASRVEGPESRAEASGMLPSSSALHGSGVTLVTGGVSDHSKFNIAQRAACGSIFRYRLQSKKNRLSDIFRA